ncbi:MAG: hypothetical protein IKP88_10730 [Lachnospiraceae bacterium]|nr:hypothetical protein [Lachnospiraceae bacterium]
MDLNEFVNLIIVCLEKELGDGYSVEHRKILKNNSIEFDSIVIMEEGHNIAPNIYMQSFYLDFINGRDIGDIIREILRVFRTCRKSDYERLCNKIDPEHFQDNIIIRLVNYEKNIEMLKQAVYDRVEDDLAVTYHYVIKCGKEKATIRIDRKLCECLGIPEKTVKENAVNNSMRINPPTFDRMDNILLKSINKYLGCDRAKKEAIETFQRNDGLNMYVLSTEDRSNGAVSLLYNGILDRISKVIGGNFYILPSSVHEIIIVPDNESMSRDFLDGMVMSVNRECVDPEEVLSDRVYYYPDNQFVISGSSVDSSEGS